MNPLAGGERVDAAILREAADWLVRLHAGDAGSADWDAVARWRATSPAHGLAWQRAEALLGDLQRLPAGPLVRATLERSGTRRRRLLQLGWLAVLPAGWLAWRQSGTPGEHWQTAAGEQRPLTLADGTRLLLNTDTRIAVQWSDTARLVRLLAGEVLVTSAPDTAPHPRPLLVATRDGTVRAIGTRFSVRRTEGDAASSVAVFEGAVEVAAGGRLRRIDSGQRLDFGPAGPGAPGAIAGPAEEAWTQGLVVARRMRLADLVAELDRYRPGLLRCHPAVAELRVSGTFPALQPERSLDLLAASLPVRVRYRTRYWATVEPA